MRNLMIIFCICFLSACGNTQLDFEKSKWKETVDGFYMFRESMANDLIENHLEKGMTYKELTDLIGEPENFSNLKENTIGYILMEDYGWDIDPVESKTLMIELTADSLVQDFNINHWKK
ncbi:hypothetical protein [Robertkochia sediminum]|uniref:hypothetical protein n=1 Tax=Robertkochia sediminum TaxID=2785326 RepID=UPI001931C3AD|nr:hypothetical protein [Robertkochia sediminum]MBL7472079.1 hypothetical protein [Robertkochia sediminum]